MRKGPRPWYVLRLKIVRQVSVLDGRDTRLLEVLASTRLLSDTNSVYNVSTIAQDSSSLLNHILLSTHLVRPCSVCCTGSGGGHCFSNWCVCGCLIGQNNREEEEG